MRQIFRDARLLRSCHVGKVFDSIPEVLTRYRNGQPQTRIEYWLPRRPIRQTRKDLTIRIFAMEIFRLRWSVDNWKTWSDSDSRPSGIGGAYFDVSPQEAKARIDFTFFWPDRSQWEGQNHHIEVAAESQVKAI